MGKTSKKVKRHVQKKVDELQLKQCQGKEQALESAFEAGDYAKVLELLADLISAKDIKPALMYKGAYSYFMLGDYERSAQWVTNTLNYDGNNVDARILLARLCFMQDRHDDGLAIYDYLAEHYLGVMTREQKDQIIDSSEYYVHRQAEKIRQQYPYLANFLQVGTSPVHTALSTVEKKTETSEGTSAISALARLKAKLQAVQAKNQQIETGQSKVETESVLPPNESAESLETQLVNIKQQSCSLRQKVQLFNKFAAGYYVAGDYKAAGKLLQEALMLDDGDAQTLRNMAMTQAALGNMDKAQAFAARLPEVDFVLLCMLKEQLHG